jgi:hypothetical protein
LKNVKNVKLLKKPTNLLFTATFPSLAPDNPRRRRLCYFHHILVHQRHKSCKLATTIFGIYPTIIFFLLFSSTIHQK